MENPGLEHSKVLNFSKIIDYSKDGIISKQLLKKPNGNVTLFSFDSGQSLSEHTAPFDALIHIIEGKARIFIDKTEFDLKKGESIVMPANIPHAVAAPEKFKMLLTMIRS